MIIIHQEKKVRLRNSVIKLGIPDDMTRCKTQIGYDQVNITHSFNTEDKTACDDCRNITKTNEIIHKQKKQMVIKPRKRKIR